MAGERAADRGDVFRLADAEQAATASGAADLAAPGAGGARGLEHGIDRRRGDAGRQPLAILPFVRDMTADRRPILALERIAHRHGDIAYPREAGAHVADPRRCAAWSSPSC